MSHVLHIRTGSDFYQCELTDEVRFAIVEGASEDSAWDQGECWKSVYPGDLDGDYFEIRGVTVHKDEAPEKKVRPHKLLFDPEIEKVFELKDSARWLVDDAFDPHAHDSRAYFAWYGGVPTQLLSGFPLTTENDVWLYDLEVGVAPIRMGHETKLLYVHKEDWREIFPTVQAVREVFSNLGIPIFGDPA